MHAAVNELRALIEFALEKNLPQSRLPGNERLNRAIRDAVFPAGKRMRPVFTLLAASAAGVNPERALNAACAVEFLHSSSLIFDDLPCMDDARMRRGRPAIHASHGESLALLAGLALFNEAYRLFGSSPRLMHEAAGAIGADGMIGGQAIDIQNFGTDPAEHAPSDDRLVAHIDARDRKTTTLMRLTLVAGALAGGAGDHAVRVLGHCGERLGRAYQMVDDLLDACAGTGKTAGQDSRHARVSYCSIEFAGEYAGAAAAEQVDSCRRLLRDAFCERAQPLISALDSVFASLAESGLAAA